MTDRLRNPYCDCNTRQQRANDPLDHPRLHDKTTVGPSIDLRQELAKHDARGRELIALREAADLRSKKALGRVVNGVKADAEDGEDSELYVEMGYKSRAARNFLQKAGRKKAAEAK